mmetsp:Transcript_28780/g.80466  ORF Transcript_28780/g.80466 Transcript_28780/m.80466 type:complete len:88 (+) Transcript_28780:1054-1317(+)
MFFYVSPVFFFNAPFNICANLAFITTGAGHVSGYRSSSPFCGVVLWCWTFCHDVVYHRAQQKLGQFLARLLKLSQEFDVAGAYVARP